MPSAALECVESFEYSCQGWKNCSNWQITQYYCFTDDGDCSVCVSVLVCHTFSYYQCCNQVVILLHSYKVFSRVDPHSAWGCLEVKVPELLVRYSGFLIMVVSTSIFMSDGLESYKTCKILNHQICVAGRIGCSFRHHLNFHNLQGSILMISFININWLPTDIQEQVWLSGLLGLQACITCFRSWEAWIMSIVRIAIPCNFWTLLLVLLWLPEKQR